MDVQDVIQDGLTWISFEVTRVANRLPTFLERSELHAIGLLAMVECAHRFDVNRNVQFRTFAVPRIRGAILDELRARDHLGRKERQAQRSKAMVDECNDQQVVDESVYEKNWLEKLQRETFSTGDDPVSTVEMHLLYEQLREAFRQLSEREQFVIRRHYFEHQRLNAIGRELSVTEGRIRQIRCRALLLLRAHLVEVMGEGEQFTQAGLFD